MSTEQLKYDQLKDMDADDVLNMDLDEIAESGFKNAPEGVYRGKVSVEVSDNEQDPKKKNVKLSVALEEIVELTKGPKGETVEKWLEQIGGEDAIANELPEAINYFYGLPAFAGRLKTDWGKVALQASGKEKITLVEMLEALEGAAVEFTHTYYRKKDKETGDIKSSANVDMISLVEV